MILHFSPGQSNSELIREHLYWVDSIKSPSFFWGLSDIVEECFEADCWVYQQEMQWVCFVLVREGLDFNEITSLATSPAYLRKGLMKALLRQVLDASQKPVLLEVHEKNKGACHLYEQLGFRSISRRPSYYRDGAGALIFQFKD